MANTLTTREVRECLWISTRICSDILFYFLLFFFFFYQFNKIFTLHLISPRMLLCINTHLHKKDIPHTHSYLHTYTSLIHEKPLHIDFTFRYIIVVAVAVVVVVLFVICCFLFTSCIVVIFYAMHFKCNFIQWVIKNQFSTFFLLLPILLCSTYI